MDKLEYSEALVSPLSFRDERCVEVHAELAAYSDERFTLLDFRAWVEAAIDAAKDDPNACIVADMGRGDDEYAKVFLKYHRPATPEEIEHRERERAKHAVEREAEERARYEALRRKYERDDS